MARHYPDWVEAYVQYASRAEAPRRMHYWTAVSVIAGALRRRVWMDEGFFRWYPNHYILFVAPPGIVSKTTTVNIGHEILQAVPGIHYGPHSTSWQALLDAFQTASETFPVGLEHLPQSAITIDSGELGNLLNPQDRELLDTLVRLWDCPKTFTRQTRKDGPSCIESPFLNIIACTTPSWLAGSFPEYAIGGGFTSRCIFVYADEKDHLVAYPSRHSAQLATERDKLLADLKDIATIPLGPYNLSTEALNFGQEWYAEHYKEIQKRGDHDRFGGYRARKQTHIHKLAMVLAAGRGDSMVVTKRDLEGAIVALSEIETLMPKVFEQIGKAPLASSIERVAESLRVIGAPQTMKWCHNQIFAQVPDYKTFLGLLEGAVAAGVIERVNVGGATLYTSLRRS